MKKLFTILVMLVAMNASGQWAQSNGPYTGAIKSFMVSGSTIYAGVDGAGIYEAAPNSNYKYMGIYTSTDNGQNWISIPVNSGLGYLNVYALAEVSTNLFAGTDSGVYRSTNNGVNWTGVSSGITNRKINTLYAHGSNLYAGTPTGIFLSANNGNTWNAANNGLTNQNIYGFTSIGTNIYVGVNGGVFMSTNNGGNWTLIGISTLNIFAIASIGNNLFAGTAGSGVYMSTNNGTNWTTINNGLLNNNVFSFGVSGTNLYVGTGGGIFYTSNNGVNWSASGITDQKVNTIGVSGGNVFSGTEVAGVFKSTNNGTNWAKSSKGLYNSNIHMFAKYGSDLFCTSSKGVFLSTDNGIHWARRNIGFDAYGRNNLDVTGICNKNDVLFASVCGTYSFEHPFGGGVYKSTNNGLQWTNCHNDSLYYYNVLGINYFGNRLYVSMNNRGVHVSTNDGYSWRLFLTMPYNPLNIISNGTYLFTADDRWDPDYLGHMVRFNSNTDYNINFGLPTKVWHSLAVEGNVLFAGTDTGRIFKSTNVGGSWVIANNGIPNTADITSLAVSGQNIFAGTKSHGLYLSKDGGNTWALKNEGLEFPVGISAIYVSGSDVLIGTTNQSVWRRAMSELLGVQNISTEIPSAYSLGQNYPNPFNPTTNLKFQIVKSGEVKLVVYDIMGREVQTLVNERLQPGTYEATFDGSNLNSGVYFYKLMTDGFTETKKMLLIK